MPRTFPAIVAEPFPGAAPPFGSKDEDSDEESESEETAAITAEPFPGAAPPFGSKDEDSDDDDSEEAEASFFAWGCDTDTADPHEHPAAIDHSEDGEARDTSVDAELKLRMKLKLAAFDACLVGNCLGFMTNALRAVAKDTGQPGITSPVSKLPPPPPGAADRAKERSKLGRGVEGDGDDGIDPMSTMDKFNWDNLPLPGLGQI